MMILPFSNALLNRHQHLKEKIFSSCAILSRHGSNVSYLGIVLCWDRKKQAMNDHDHLSIMVKCNADNISWTKLEHLTYSYVIFQALNENFGPKTTWATLMSHHNETHKSSCPTTKTSFFSSFPGFFATTTMIIIPNGKENRYY